MDHVTGVSWPRSGHHLLVRMLKLYFGETFGYCDFYGGIEGCCKTVPCTRTDSVHLTKSHDFHQEVPQIEGRKYLVQYRDYLPSGVSNYELFLLNKPKELDTRETFVAFISQQFTAYRIFMDRWVTSEFGADQLQLSYEQLLAYPKESLRLAVWWLDPQTPVDEARLDLAIAQVSGEKVEAWQIETLQSVGVHEDRDLSEFRHYEPELFSRLSRLKLTRQEVADAFMSLLGRPPVEKTYLTFQCLDSIEALEAALCDSEEYRQRQASSGSES